MPIYYTDQMDKRSVPQEERDNGPQREAYRRLLQLGVTTGLTDCQREALLLYYQQGLTLRQVAERLEIHPSSAARRVERGRKRLQRMARLYLACHQATDHPVESLFDAETE